MNPFKKIFVLLAVLVGVAINVALINEVTKFGSKAATTVPSIYFSPDTAIIPPNATVNLMVDPAGQTISFIRVKISFDKAILNLASAIDISISPLQQIISVTPVSQANSTGQLEIVLAQKPGATVPKTTFQLASMIFKLAPGATSSQSTQITVVNQDTQMVNNLSVAVNFGTPNYVSVNPPTAAGGANKSTNVTPLNSASGTCPSGLYIDTAIGCIPYSDSQAMARFFLSWGLGIGGGIAFILIVYASYMIITSQGDPKRLQSGKELLTGALTGLIMLLFSAFLLRFIGVNLFGIF